MNRILENERDCCKISQIAKNPSVFRLERFGLFGIKRSEYFNTLKEMFVALRFYLGIRK